IVADLELENGNGVPEVAVAIVVAVNVPLALAVHEVGAVFDDAVRAMMVRLGVDHRVHIRHERGPFEQLEKQRVVIEHVEKPRALLALRVGEAGLLRPGSDQLAAAHDGAIHGRAEAGDMVRLQEVFEDEVALIVEEEALGVGRDAGFDGGGKGSGFSHGEKGNGRDVVRNSGGQKADSGWEVNSALKLPDFSPRITQ